MLANRYGVPADVLLKVNGFASASQVQAGTHLVIPVYRATAAGAQPTHVAPAAKTARVEPAPTHLAATPEARAEAPTSAKQKVKIAEKTPSKPAKAAKVEDDQEEKAAPRKVAEAKPKAVGKKVKVAVKSDDDEDEKPVAKVDAKAKDAAKPVAKAKVAKPEPQFRISKTEPAREPVKTPALESHPAQVEKRETQRPAAAEPPPVADRKVERIVDKSDTTSSIPPTQEAKVSDSAHPEFRWPARGRVIQGFASGGNDGINIALPEGTQVKAAEAGVVAYAGSELKGYGNLVLIRHPNGFVTAYAHNGDISVKRGDQVTRGQTIARSGQSGNVGSPQLHFELRKGSQPVDPTSYLAGL